MFRLRIMCGQINHRLTATVLDDSSHRLQGDRLAGTNTIDFFLDERLLRVSRIARQEVVDIAIHDNHRDVPWCVSWGRHDDDCAVRCDEVGPIKGSEGFRLEDDRPGRKPTRPSIGQVTPKSTSEPFRKRQFLVRYKDLAPGEVMQTARMIRVQMGEDDGAHIVGANAEKIGRASCRERVFNWV